YVLFFKEVTKMGTHVYNSLFIDPKNRWWFFISILFVLGAFVAGVNRSFLNLPTIELHWQEEESWQQYTPSYTNVSGRELVMIYIGSSSCGFSNAPDLPKLIEDTKMSLQDQANNKDWSFSAVGISIDWNTSDGINHLNKFGHFDEVITGRKWNGTGANQYLKNIPGVYGTPQIVIIMRESDIDDENIYNTTITETFIYRMVGIFQIESWYDRGIPLPQDVLMRFSNPASEI
ncbi:MAG: hypothetical protein OXF84_07370, partial [Bacteroidetes bacterium]|nr:hypothetical protein [Bacteroidota bacterium]